METKPIKLINIKTGEIVDNITIECMFDDRYGRFITENKEDWKDITYNSEKIKISDKDFHCRQCSTFLDSNELKNGCCPDCGTDDDVFMNDINE